MTGAAPATPARPRLREALAVVMDRPLAWFGPRGTECAAVARFLRRGWRGGCGPDPVVEPRAAWEALSSRLDLDATDAADRLFEGPSGCLYGCGWDEGRHHELCPGKREPTLTLARAHPLTVAAAVALAADWPVVLAAEALAREAAARLEAFGCAPPRGLCWAVAPFDPEQTCWTSSAARAPAWRHAVGHAGLVHRSQWWPAYERRGGTRATMLAPGDTWRWLATHADVWADPRPNPWAPLADVWGLGYAVRALEPTLVLVAPPLPGGSAA